MALEGYIKRVIKVEMPALELSKDAGTILNTSKQKIYPETIISETFIVEDTKALSSIVAKEKVKYVGEGHSFRTDGRVLVGS